MDYSQFKSKMDKTLNVLKEELATIRAGRANPNLLNKLMVNYYGTPTPITQLANIQIPEARQMIIQPWDAKILNDVVKAIQMSDLGLNPNNDGKVIRLMFPPLTEERRVELTRDAKKLGENSKVAVRQIRRDAVEFFKKKEKAKEISKTQKKIFRSLRMNSSRRLTKLSLEK